MNARPWGWWWRRQLMFSDEDEAEGEQKPAAVSVQRGNIWKLPKRRNAACWPTGERFDSVLLHSVCASRVLLLCHLSSLSFCLICSPPLCSLLLPYVCISAIWGQLPCSMAPRQQSSPSIFIPWLTLTSLPGTSVWSAEEQLLKTQQNGSALEWCKGLSLIF